MRFKAKFLVLFLLIPLFFACSEGVIEEKNPDPDVIPPTLPPAESFEGFETIDTPSGIQIKISSSLFGQQFLVQSSLAYQKEFTSRPDNPRSTGLKSRVVSFKRDGDKILMLEYSKPYVPDEKYPSELLFATFPITEEKTNHIVFDFNKGMNDIFNTSEWYNSDFEGKSITPDIAIEINNSYLSNAKKYDNAISFEQIMTVKSDEIQKPAIVTYYIKKYVQNPSFVQKKSPGFDYLGYFEANPIVENDIGTTYTNITIFDISKPIKYYISANTPKEYQNAMLQGILYWNKAFGKDVLIAEVAPEGITAPSFEHNIVQWHVRKMPGSAYADTQVDPLTGEILHAQVFIPSSFSEWTRAYVIPEALRDDKKDVGTSSIETTSANKDFFLLPKSAKRPIDIVNLSEKFKDTYKFKDSLSSISKENYDKLTGYILTALVAHEVGHTLGLRHNFAGSLVSDLTARELNEQALNLIKTGNLPNDYKPTTNSIMEYIDFYDEIMLGAYMQDSETPALSHDKYAIEWAYISTSNKPNYTGEIFCTDSDLKTYIDCNKYDSGKNIIERISFKIIDNYINIPKLLAENYLNSKTNFNEEERIPVKEATPSSFKIAQKTAIPFIELVEILSFDIKLKSILINYPDLSDIDSDLIKHETFNWLNEQIAYANSVNDIFKSIDPIFYKNTINNFQKEFETLIKSKTYTNVKLSNGEQAGFTVSEIEYMLNRSGDLFSKIEENLAYIFCFILKQANFKQINYIEEIEKKISIWSSFVLTDLNKSEFYFSLETRKQALEVLLAKGPYPDWMQQYIPEIAKQLRSSLEIVFGMPISDIKPEDFPREQMQYIMDELNIYSSIARFIEDDDTDQDETEF